MTLYGFVDPDARLLFGLLQTVTGVGPRLAMATWPSSNRTHCGGRWPIRTPKHRHVGAGDR